MLEEGRAVDREELYRAICSLSDEDVSKVDSYVSFLLFVAARKEKSTEDPVPEAVFGQIQEPESVPDPVLRPDPGSTDFYAPVRSPRLEQEPSFSLFDQTEYSPGPKESLFPDPALSSFGDSFFAEKSPAAGLVTEPAKPGAEYVTVDNFFMPVRSELFDELRRPVPPEKKNELPEQEEPDETDSSGNAFDFTPEPAAPAEPSVPVQTFLPVSMETAFSADTDSMSPRIVETRQSLLRVAKSFRISWEDVAKLFDLPQNMLWRWYGGDSPGEEQEAKLDYFLTVAERLEELKIPRFELFVHRPASTGMSFLEKLRRQKVTGQDFKILKDLAARSEELRKKPKGAARPFYSFEDTINLYSTPLHGEAEE